MEVVMKDDKNKEEEDSDNESIGSDLSDTGEIQIVYIPQVIAIPVLSIVIPPQHFNFSLQSLFSDTQSNEVVEALKTLYAEQEKSDALYTKGLSLLGTYSNVNYYPDIQLAGNNDEPDFSHHDVIYSW